MEKTRVGLIEEIEIEGQRVLAKIDTGATKSSISLDLASKWKLGPIVKTVKVVSSHGRTTRPVVKTVVKLSGRKINAYFNIVDRKRLRYPVLIGQNILKMGFLVDPSKK